ncbi:MAG: carboxypeptidase regulatory-like domain-containing protein, partial [Planctomycetia bacterium]
MTPRLVPMTPACRRLVSLVVAAAIAAAAGRTQAAPLVWEADLQAALEAGRTRHQQVVVFFSTDTPECRRFEAEGLGAAIVREGLANVVPVRVEGDAAAAEQLASPGPPALVFVNPLTGTVFHRIGGWHGVERLAREIVHARRAMSLPLTPGLGPVARRMFSLDEEKASGLLDAGDARGLVALLAPAAADESRLADYGVVQVVLPRGLTPDGVTFLAGTDCLVGNPVTAAERHDPLVAARPPDLSECSAELPLPESGLVLVPVAREQRPEIALRITAAGCLPVEDRVRFAGGPPGSAVQERRYALRRLDRTTAVRLAGRVLTADGRKASGAVVRIVDWLPQPNQPAAATTTGTDGGFAFPQVPPGRWLVRAEYPG